MARIRRVKLELAFGALLACKTSVGYRSTQAQMKAPLSRPALTKLGSDTLPMDAPAVVATAGAFFDIRDKIQASHFVFETQTHRLYAASMAGGIHVSVDQGKTWTTLKADGRCRQALPLSNGQVYAVCDDTLLLREPNTDIWQSLPLPQGGTRPIQPQIVAVSAARPQRLYMAGRGEADYSGLFRSEDHGKTWQGIDSITLLDDDGTVNRIAPVDELVRGFEVHPTNPDFIVALLTYGVFLSVDGGANFVKAGLLATAPALPNYLVETKTYSQASRVFFDAADPKTAYVLSEEGLEITRDGGVSWRTFLSNEPLVHIAAHPSIGGVLYAQTARPAMLVSQRYGDSWQVVAPVEVPGSERSFFTGWTSVITPTPQGLPPSNATLAVSPATGRLYGSSDHGTVVFVGVRGTP